MPKPSNRYLADALDQLVTEKKISVDTAAFALKVKDGSFEVDMSLLNPYETREVERRAEINLASDKKLLADLGA